MKNLKFAILPIVVLLISTFFSCSDDDNLKPITLRDHENTTINLFYPSETGYSYLIQGGDGNYSVKSSNSDIISSEMISPWDVSLKAISVGEATVTITDNSQNVLVLTVNVDYQTQSFVVKKHDIKIVEGDLTENEKKAISKKFLAEIPIKVGGGYKFIFTDKPNNKGKAIVYTDMFGIDGIETTFKIVDNQNIVESLKWGYEVTINNEKRTLILGRYIPTIRATESITMALMEDITEKVQKEYPKAEFVLTSQVIERPSY